MRSLLVRVQPSEPFRQRLSHVAGYEGTVEPSSGLGEFDCRHFEKPSRGADEPGGDVASAAGATHVVKGLPDGGHVEFLGGKEWCFHGLRGLSPVEMSSRC